MAGETRRPPRICSFPSNVVPLCERNPPKQKFHLLVVACGPRDTSWAQALVVRLSKNPLIETRAIVDDVVPRLSQTTNVLRNQSMRSALGEDFNDIHFYKKQSYTLVEWADLMVCVPLDADAISKMLAGIADSVIGEVLRGWDTEKPIVLVPGMSKHAWANPMTQRQISKIRRKWDWIRVMEPIIWRYKDFPHMKRVAVWNGFNQVLSTIQKQTEKIGLGNDVELLPGYNIPEVNGKIETKLPSEIWTLIFEYAGDWELAKSLDVYTSLPVPPSWRHFPAKSRDDMLSYEHELDWCALTSETDTICRKLSQAPKDFQELPTRFIRLVIRFALMDVIAYIEANRPDLFKGFEGTLLPTLASAAYPRIEVLEFWRESKWFDYKIVYNAEAVDGASKSGFVHILDWWWRQSGLPLRYTESSLEQASANGHVGVLQWWQDAAAQDDSVVLRPGRSLLWAAQHGQSRVLRWWESSGIPVAHGEGVAKVASHWGKVDALETWRRLKGSSKIVYDSEILVPPSVHHHLEVLEWWRRFAHGELEGMDGERHLVEYRPFSIEDAIDESPGDQTGVRQWWASVGLDFTSHTDGWTKTRHL